MAHSPANTPPTFSRSKIGYIHTRLRTALTKILRQKVRIVPRFTGDYAKVARGTTVKLFLISEKGQDRSLAQGRGEPVLYLPDLRNQQATQPNHAWWVAWTEEWRKLRDNQFAFRTAGWRVYCGPPSFQRDKQLVLRAEWGPLSDNESLEPSNAGQPHWHSQMSHIIGAINEDFIDNNGGIERPSASDIGLSGEVVRLSEGVVRSVPLQTKSLDFSGVHLAMAGWTNATAPPEQWQHVVDEEFSKTLRDWSVATLKYLQSQMGEMRIR